MINRFLSLTEGDVIDLSHLPEDLLSPADASVKVSGEPDRSLADEPTRYERAVLSRVLAHTNGNMSKTAKLPGISRSTLYEKCKKLNVEPPQ